MDKMDEMDKMDTMDTRDTMNCSGWRQEAGGFRVLGAGGECFGSTFRPKHGWLKCLQKLEDNIMLDDKLPMVSQLSRG